MSTIGETTFHNGDRVVAVVDCIDHNEYIRRGLTGTVCADYPGHGRVRIEWDAHVYGHDCLGTCKDGYGWAALPNEIRHFNLIEKETDEILVKEDDLMSFLFS